MPLFPRRSLCQFVARVGVAYHSQPRIVIQHAGNLARCHLGTVGHRHLTRVQTESHAHAAAVVEAHPVAPEAVFSSAFRIGQSATASLPSSIFSVSR